MRNINLRAVRDEVCPPKRGKYHELLGGLAIECALRVNLGNVQIETNQAKLSSLFQRAHTDVRTPSFRCGLHAFERWHGSFRPAALFHTNREAHNEMKESPHSEEAQNLQNCPQPAGQASYPFAPLASAPLLRALDSSINMGTHSACLRLVTTQDVLLPVNPHVSRVAC